MFNPDNQFDQEHKDGGVVESGDYRLVNEPVMVSFDSIDDAAHDIDGFGGLTLELFYFGRDVTYRYKVDISDQELRLARMLSTIYGPNGEVIFLDKDLHVFRRIETANE